MGEIKLILILALMILWDFSMHLFEIFNITIYHPLYINFPFLGIDYGIFWTIYWGSAFLMAVILLMMNKEGINELGRKMQEE